MKTKKNIFTTAVAIMFVIFIVATAVSLLKKYESRNADLVGLNYEQKIEKTPVPTSIPSSTPTEFKFDASTDLKKELESVDPKVLDSDFE